MSSKLDKPSPLHTKTTAGQSSTLCLCLNIFKKGWKLLGTGWWGLAVSCSCMDRKCVLPFQSRKESKGSGGKGSWPGGGCSLGCWPGDVSGSVETFQSGQSERLKVSWKSHRTIRLLFNRGEKKMRERKNKFQKRVFVLFSSEEQSIQNGKFCY